jgi:fluoroacetyl-CoA thioesterase
MRDTLQTGIERDDEHTVTKEVSAPHLPVVVLATPAMVSLIERTCLLAVQPHLDDGETTVGTHVCVSHQAAAMEGETVTVHGHLTKIDRRRLTFAVTVTGPRGIISEGTHERAVLSRDRFG